MRLCRLLLTGGFALGGCCVAELAQGETSPPPHSAGVAISPLMSFADVCDRQADLVTCSARPYLSAELSGRFSLDSTWSLGPILWYGIEAGSRGTGTSTGSSVTTITETTTHLGGLSIAAYYAPFEGGLWLSPRAGGLVFRDLSETRTGSGPTESASSLHWGAELGAAAGYDIWLSPSFALSVHLKASQTLFRIENGLPRDGGSRTESGPLVALSLGGLFAFDGEPASPD